MEAEGTCGVPAAFSQNISYHLCSYELWQMLVQMRFSARAFVSGMDVAHGCPDEQCHGRSHELLARDHMS